MHRLTHRQMDTLSSVAILLSHTKCWQWLVDHPIVPAALILEDDACFDPPFRVQWQETVLPMLKVMGNWDCMVLGYFATQGVARGVPPCGNAVSSEVHRTVPDTVPPVSTQMVSQFFGAHAYLVTQRGARVLLQHSLPIEHQVDGLFLTLHELVVPMVTTTRRAVELTPCAALGGIPMYERCQPRGFVLRPPRITVGNHRGRWRHTHSTVEQTHATSLYRYETVPVVCLFVVLLAAIVGTGSGIGSASRTRWWKWYGKGAIQQKKKGPFR